MPPRLGKVMGAENHVEDKGVEGNRSLRKMLQCPFRYTVRARSLADLENPHGRFFRLILNAGRYRRTWVATQATFEICAATAFRTAPEKFSIHVSIVIPLRNSGSNETSSSKRVWNLAQSVRLKSGRSGEW